MDYWWILAMAAMGLFVIYILRQSMQRVVEGGKLLTEWASEHRFQRLEPSWIKRSGRGSPEFGWAADFAFFQDRPRGAVGSHCRGFVGEFRIDAFDFSVDGESPIFMAIRVICPTPFETARMKASLPDFDVEQHGETLLFTHQGFFDLAELEAIVVAAERTMVS